MSQTTLNGIDAMSVRISIPWRGVWVAHCELNVDEVALAQLTGPAILTIGDDVAIKTLLGTIDPRGSGTFGDRAHVRVVGGQGGWDKAVPAQDFYNPAAVLSTQVYAATAAAVKELPPLDPTPIAFGTRFARSAGVASRVFGDLDWYVDPTTGAAVVSAWPPALPDPDWTIADFDIDQKVIKIFSSNLIVPGTPIVDERFNGVTYIARDVEQTFTKDGNRAEIWVAEAPVSRLQEAFANMVREFAGTRYLKTYRYRFVAPAGTGAKLAVQAITPGAPDLNPLDQWTGLSGALAAFAGIATIQPSSEMVVGFAGGLPTDPYIAAFSPAGQPQALTFDPVLGVFIGAGALPVTPTAMAVGVATAISTIQAEIAAIAVKVPSLAPAADVISQAATAVAAALLTIPSKKLFSE